MALLYVLAFFIPVWKRAIAISDKLHPKTWEFLTLCSLILLIASFCVGGILLTGELPAVNQRTTSARSSSEPVQRFARGGVTSLGLEEARLRLLDYDSPGFRKLFEREPVRAAPVAAPELSGFQKKLMFWAGLLGMLVSSLTSIVTTTLAWIAFHRKRAEALLLTLELEKRRLEIKHLRLELEQAKEEHDRAKAVPSKIVIPN
jgi:hypothetical protein